MKNKISQIEKKISKINDDLRCCNQWIGSPQKIWYDEVKNVYKVLVFDETNCRKIVIFKETGDGKDKEKIRNKKLTRQIQNDSKY